MFIGKGITSLLTHLGLSTSTQRGETAAFAAGFTVSGFFVFLPSPYLDKRFPSLELRAWAWFLKGVKCSSFLILPRIQSNLYQRTERTWCYRGQSNKLILANFLWTKFILVLSLSSACLRATRSFEIIFAIFSLGASEGVETFRRRKVAFVA